MKYTFWIFSLLLYLTGCQATKLSHDQDSADVDKLKYLVESVPDEIPQLFKEDLIPQDRIIHKGVFSSDMGEYYYTVSDKDFTNFDVYVIKKDKENWSDPQAAFFNSDYDDHGMSFSSEGNTLYFSSNRPTAIAGIPATWHIWKSNKMDQQWGTPTFVDIPNLRDKLVSHPIITDSGTLYFHSSRLDYGDMDIYHTKRDGDGYGAAIKSSISIMVDVGKCTPYVSPDEDYMIFAMIGEQLDLAITFNDGLGNWSKTRKLSDKINIAGQGNPYVTPDNKYLFFTTGDASGENWEVKWVNIEAATNRN